MTTRSGQRGHVMVDLFYGWHTDVEPCNSTSPDYNDLHSTRTVPSSTRQVGSTDAASQFQSINLAKRDTSFAASLYSGRKHDDELDQEELERIKRLPPSKRPGVSHAKKTPPNHIKRPRNAYIIFRSHTVSQKLIPKEVENDHRNISRIIAHMWKSLAPEDRAYYEQIAKDEKERHKAMFPDYRYQPITRRGEVNRRNVKKLENGDEECQEIADIILKAQGKDGVVVRSEPSKPMKRAREATRSASARTSGPRKKRVKVEATKQTSPDSPALSGEQVLETVFLHESLSSSPVSQAGSEAGSGLVPALSPEPFRLESCTPSINQGPESPSRVTSPIVLEPFGRRASSAPILRPCSPPPSFATVTAESIEQTPASALVFDGVDLDPDVAQPPIEYSSHATMPAPSWKARKALPPPIPNTWQFCSYDDQSIPSPRTIDGFGSANKCVANRPRTAWPSTPSSGTFRGFFHPWAFEHSNETMLVSPMTASFQDLRRRSSLGRSGSLSVRRPGSFGLEPHHGTDGRIEAVDGSHGLLPTSDLRMSDGKLFDDATRLSDHRMGSETVTADGVEGATFAFDPALEGEGCEPAVSDSSRGQPSYAGDQADHFPFTALRYKHDSPRPSFSGSTLAAAARDWASMKRRRSRMTPSTFGHVVNESMPSMGTQGSCGSMDYTLQRETDKARRYKSSLEESLERAVLLALGKESGQDRGEQNSKIVQQILTSISAELALQQQQGQAASTSHCIFFKMVRGPKHHLKRLNAPSSWMLDKLSGTYAPRPSNGPHKLREALPLVILLRNRLKYALTGREVNAITAQRLIKIDGKVRTDPTYPTGFQDVVSIEKSGEHFRILYDVKGRFIVHRITAEEATYKLLKVKKVQLGARGVPHIVTHDGRTIRYPDPAIKVNDTVRFDIDSQKILDFVAFDTGATVMVTGGRNQGRAGVITGRERHLGGFDIVHIRDVLGRDFSTRLSNVFVIGTDGKPMISMPRGGGVALTITEERDQRRRQKEARGQ